MEYYLLIPRFSVQIETPDSENSVPPIGMGYIYTQLTLSGYECQFIDALLMAYFQTRFLKSSTNLMQSILVSMSLVQISILFAFWWKMLSLQGNFS